MPILPGSSPRQAREVQRPDGGGGSSSERKEREGGLRHQDQGRQFLIKGGSLVARGEGRTALLPTRKSCLSDSC